MRKRWLLVGGAGFFLALAVTALLAFGSWGREYARAELNLANLTCGSCVAKVQQALAGVRGVGPVDVSVTSGRARVDFEPAAVTAEAIAERITAAGYPARVAEVLSPQEVTALEEDITRLAERYVARVGGRLVSRTELAAEMERLRAGVAPGQPVNEMRLRQMAWQQRVERELMLADAEARKVVVQEGEVALEVDRMRGGMQDFPTVVARFGGEEAFGRLVKEQLLIQRHLADNVLRGETEPARKQAVFDHWYRGLAEKYPVTILDPELKAAVEKKGGCGGSCCG